jgi:hypothetical protein
MLPMRFFSGSEIWFLRSHASIESMISTFSFRAPCAIWLAATVAGLFLVVAAGCGPKRPPMAPVKGKVILDGQPLTKGNVSTVPDAGRGAHGDIQPDGTFELYTYRAKDGALVGKHKVAVAAYDASAGKGPESEYGKLLVPKHYTNYETSGLTIDVKDSEPNTPTLELTSQ